MKGHPHVSSRRFAAIGLSAGLGLGLLPGLATAADDIGLPECTVFTPAGAEDGTVVEPWRVLLDRDGAVTGHRMTLRRHGQATTIRLGRRGFAVPAGPSRMLLGERSETGTQLSLVDTAAGCVLWTRAVGSLAYARDHAPSDEMRLTLHAPGTRAYQGTLVLDPETGATAALIDEECNSACAPNDGEVPPAAFGPAGYARPVPRFSAGGWAKDKTLTFRWGGGDVPPTWAKDPIRKAADDARRTAAARSPVFDYRSSASNAIRYTGDRPSFCGAAIACAGRSKPAAWWGVWITPHGTDFSWGTLRWCQKNQSSSGCFDMRRVLLHELGHVSGLNHPEVNGYKLAPHETVMHAITPVKPTAGSTRHAWGRCDVATLQELYDVPVNKTPISTCNDVATKLRLWANTDSVSPGASVKLKAQLSIADRNGYGKLADNPLNKRSVKLKWRRAGSNAGWSTAWMRFQSSGRYDLDITPQGRWEFKATFPEPRDEGLRFSRSEIVEVRVR